MYLSQDLGRGVGAAALATIISQYVSAALCIRQLLRSKESYRLRIRKIRFDKEMLKQIVKIGLPSGFMNSVISIANVVVQSNINAFGEMAMAGCGAYSKIEGFGFLPITSFTMALTTFVGQNLGAKQYERTKKGAKFGIICAVVIAEIIGILIYVFATPLIAAFDHTPEVVAYGVERAKNIVALLLPARIFTCDFGGIKRSGEISSSDDCYGRLLVCDSCVDFDCGGTYLSEYTDRLLDLSDYVDFEYDRICDLL